MALANYAGDAGGDFLRRSAPIIIRRHTRNVRRNYLGARVHDVLRSLDLLYAEGATEIELAGRGLGAVTAAFAALLHPRRPKVRLWHYLPSYQMLIEAQYYTWPLSIMPRGVLRYFDLPDVYRVLGRRLRKSAPWDARMRAPRHK